jgi:pSer/pThr/pTyr-binding forkhead associated (FHA) protein
MPRLLIKKRAEIIAEYKINNLRIINIGSIKANDIFLADKNISENHCTITKVSDTYEIKDNNTLAGTTLNKKSITISELKYNDEIGIGNYTLLFLKDALNIMREIEEDYSLDESKEKNYFLLGIYGRFEGKKYHIKNSGTFIGREKISPKGIENDAVLAGDMTVSKGHAKIVLRENLYFLKDIGSTGGVAINGKKVGQLNEIPIKSGDEIAIGRTIFRFAEDGNDDYSLPQNHEIFLLKARGPFISFIVISSLIISFMLGYSGIVE